ncbi:MAG: metal ABC transporter substrate-binding protein [Planctomycetota bacterium]|nr:metal ABC transporter substrate-binding protein [Planctomycetota bacterium]
MLRRGWLAAVLAFAFAFAAQGSEPAEKLKVCATLPELGSLVRAIGGDAVEATVFAKGTEDAHFLEAKPSFVTSLARADALALVGLDLEIGWAPALWEQARNARVQPGGGGHWDCSRVIEPLEIPAVPVDRSMGDVHPGGNPHFLLDPLEGLKVAGFLKERLSELRPAQRAQFEENLTAFRRALCERLAGPELAGAYDAEKLARLHAGGKLLGFLESQGQRAKLGGWLGAMAPHRGAEVVDDHALWPYLARTFGLKIAAHLEPLPGMGPTSRHLAQVTKLMQERKIGVLVTSAHYDPKSAELVSRRTGARIARLAHSAGALPGTGEYLDLLDHNVRTLAAALANR